MSRRRRPASASERGGAQLALTPLATGLRAALMLLATRHRRVRERAVLRISQVAFHYCSSPLTRSGMQSRLAG
jgi:hypothetical protein